MALLPLPSMNLLAVVLGVAVVEVDAAAVYAVAAAAKQGDVLNTMGLVRGRISALGAPFLKGLCMAGASREAPAVDRR